MPIQIFSAVGLGIRRGDGMYRVMAQTVGILRVMLIAREGFRAGIKFIEPAVPGPDPEIAVRIFITTFPKANSIITDTGRIFRIMLVARKDLCGGIGMCAGRRFWRRSRASRPGLRESW